MRNFIFFFVLLLGLVGYECRKIVKRSSLASRFTSNPFFLRHFSGDYHYEIHHPRVHFLTDADFSEHQEEGDSEEEEGSEEECQEIPTFTDSSINEERNPVTESSKTQIVEPIFNTLPFYEKIQIFQTAKPKEPQNESNDETIIYLFRSLPHYHQPILFKAKTPEAITTKNNKFAVTYYFKSLPHFETSVKFQEPTLFVSKIENEVGKEESTFRNVPHFKIVNLQTPEPKRRKVVRVIKRKKGESEDAPKVSETEFGRRLKPKIIIKSVADLPLDKHSRSTEHI